MSTFEKSCDAVPLMDGSSPDQVAQNADQTEHCHQHSWKKKNHVVRISQFLLKMTNIIFLSRKFRSFYRKRERNVILYTVLSFAVIFRTKEKKYLTKTKNTFLNLYHNAPANKISLESLYYRGVNIGVLCYAILYKYWINNVKQIGPFNRYLKHLKNDFLS